jgi:hypothetical protein
MNLFLACIINIEWIGNHDTENIEKELIFKFLRPKK